MSRQSATSADLPRGAADVPAKYKGEAWARLGVDVDNQFQPLYIVTPEKRGKVSELRDALKSVDELLLATDPDREGEAIAWHLLDTLKPKVPVRRMVFHEITEPAIRAAAANLRDLDQDLVDAQETRRILDRLYGYEVSPVLWKKVMPRLSAGRVQSVATRIIVQRERERMAFVAAGYWDIAAIRLCLCVPGSGWSSSRRPSGGFSMTSSRSPRRSTSRPPSWPATATISTFASPPTRRGLAPQRLTQVDDRKRAVAQHHGTRGADRRDGAAARPEPSRPRPPSARRRPGRPPPPSAPASSSR